ncbi:BadF/BadG/BcrA/BcrD ATPase family protein [Collinsella tanakaei]|uniref:BadF/BadG/BcrA/BcrD ATPase family protein n=1 Tax=Collinsella tanakaei TaxID=626935 RepID=UPI001F456304|nr:BadF/BadG/BcrA/BcrD ATPase family protein [Collinsella tanakaei]MCF2621976.1 BadF/BadG/BcrA/BcrD type ATPase [Collinsella tanakaei]
MRWLGIDGGGTKTACSVYDENLDRLDRTVLTTCHYAQVGLDGMERVLRDGIAWAQTSGHLDDAFGIGLSLCGYGEDARADAAIRDIVAALAGQNPYALVNDVEAAWAAGLDMADGIALIAGTGSIAYGVCRGRTMRCGGWDYEIGDEGSGGWMGKELLRAFTRQADGRDARGPLYELVRRELDLHDDFDIIPFARRAIADRTRIAALSRLVTDAAGAGDASAHAIMAAAAREEADMARAIVEGIFDDAGGTVGTIPVALIGGTFNAGELILEPLRAALPATCRLVAPAHEPDLGAVLILRARMERTA